MWRNTAERTAITMNKKRDKASLLTTGVTVLLILFFFGGIFLGLNNVLAMEGQYPPNILTEGSTPAPASAGEAVDCLLLSLEKVKSQKPKIDSAASFSANNDTFTTTGSEQLNAALGYIRNSCMSALAENETCVEAAYGSSLPDGALLCDIAESDVESFTCEYIYYVCPSCGKESDARLDTCGDCGNTDGYTKKYRDNYRVTLNLKLPKDKLPLCFCEKQPSDYENHLNALCGGQAEISDTGIRYTALTAVYEVKRLTDELVSLSYEKTAEVETKLSFLNGFSVFEGGKLGCAITQKTTFTFTWPSVTLSAHTMDVAPKGSDNLVPTLVCADPINTEVSWTSSDEAVVKVDEEGYFKAGKNAGEAVITATITFMGKAYSDSCTVRVRNSVEGLKMSPKKLTLSPGDTKELKVTVSPKNATVKTLKWYTENESVATVDENGTVKAVAPGKVTVYCLSDDGYYKSSCEVNVK